MLLAGLDWEWIVVALIGLFMAGISNLVGDYLAKYFRDLFPFLDAQQIQWLIEPVEAADLPIVIREHFDRHTPAFEQLGFTHVADYVLLRTPRVSAVRHFLSKDGQVIGEIVVLHKKYTYSCISLAANGAYLETGRGILIPTNSKEKRLVAFRAPGWDVATLVEHHQRCVADYADQRQTELVALDADDLPDVLRYAQKVVAHALIKDGVVDELPDFLKAKQTIDAV